MRELHLDRKGHGVEGDLGEPVVAIRSPKASSSARLGPNHGAVGNSSVWFHRSMPVATYTGGSPSRSHAWSHGAEITRGSSDAGSADGFALPACNSTSLKNSHGTNAPLTYECATADSST